MPRYDCFTFINELDILEIRLKTMAEVIDTFVIVEAPWTFQGASKPLYFNDNRRRFRHYLPRIRHIVVEDLMAYDNPWHREYYQRNALRRGLMDAAPDDMVFISDADEILRPAAVLEADRRAVFCFLRMNHYYYRLNWKVARPWMKSYCAPWSFLREIRNLSAPRTFEAEFLVQHGMDPAAHILEDCGWHFAWTGGIPMIMYKLGAYAHTGPHVQAWRDEARLLPEVARGRFFSTKEQTVRVALDTMPDIVQQRRRYYRRKGLLESRAGSLLRLFRIACSSAVAKITKLTRRVQGTGFP